MLQALKLLIPALAPSWRFFDYIAPSPRIQYALLDSQQKIIADWVEFRTRPVRVSCLQMLSRLFWNPHWNESLFLVSCAERIMEQHTTHSVAHSESEILARILDDWQRNQLPECPTATAAQFRLLLVQRIGLQLQQQACFTSKVMALPARVIQ